MGTEASCCRDKPAPRARKVPQLNRSHLIDESAIGLFNPDDFSSGFMSKQRFLKSHPSSSSAQFTCFCFLYGADPSVGIDFEAYRRFRKDTFDDGALARAQAKIEVELKRHIEAAVATDEPLRRLVKRARAKSRKRPGANAKSSFSTIDALVREGVVERLILLRSRRREFERIGKLPKSFEWPDDEDRGVEECKCCR